MPQPDPPPCALEPAAPAATSSLAALAHGTVPTAEQSGKRLEGESIGLPASPGIWGTSTTALSVGKSMWSAPVCKSIVPTVPRRRLERSTENNPSAGTGKMTTTPSARRHHAEVSRSALSVGVKSPPAPAPPPSPVHRSAPPSAERRTSIAQTQNDATGARKNRNKQKPERRLCHANQNFEISLRLL